MIDITYEDNYVDKEDDLIKKYMLKYSELPPLNHKFIRQ